MGYGCNNIYLIMHPSPHPIPQPWLDFPIPQPWLDFRWLICWFHHFFPFCTCCHSHYPSDKQGYCHVIVAIKSGSHELRITSCDMQMTSNHHVSSTCTEIMNPYTEIMNHESWHHTLAELGLHHNGEVAIKKSSWSRIPGKITRKNQVATEFLAEVTTKKSSCIRISEQASTLATCIYITLSKDGAVIFWVREYTY